MPANLTSKRVVLILPKLQILYDGVDVEVVAALQQLTCVTLSFVRQPFASAKEIQDFDAWNYRHWQWGGCALKPCASAQGTSCHQS